MNNKYKPKDFWKNNFGEEISTKCQTNIQRKLRRSLLNMLLKNKFTDNLRSCQENMSNKSFMMKLEEAKCYK